MREILIALLTLALAGQALAQDYVSSEDRSRFTEELYKRQEPGMLSRSAYIEIAKSAIRGAADKRLLLRTFSLPTVSHRIYRDAPPADRDIIAVQFVYQGDVAGGGYLSGDFIYMKKGQPIPVLQALIRKNGSKVYLNMINYKN